MATWLPLLLWAALHLQQLLAVERDAANNGLCERPGHCARSESTRGSSLVQVRSRMEAKASHVTGERRMLKQDSHGRVLRNFSEVLLLQAGAMRPATDSERAAFLNEHNEVRCMHGSPAVSWSVAMAASAAEYAGPLRNLVHSQSYDIPPPAGPAGENLYWSSAPSSPSQVVTSWYSEVDDCQGGPAGFTDGCKDGAGGKATGHFTALIWKGVKEIGCAWSDDSKIALCRYKGDDVLNSNTPNMQGSYVQQVPVQIKDRAACQSGGPQPQPNPTPTPAPSTPAPTPSPTTSGCVDSATYRDPWWNDPCSAWVGYRCTGYSFSDDLLSNCPVACLQCTPSSPTPTPAAPTPAPPAPTPAPPSPTPAPPTPAPPTPAPPTPAPPTAAPPTPAPPTPAPPTPAPPTPAPPTPAPPTPTSTTSAPSDGCVSGSGAGGCSLNSSECGGQVSFSVKCTAADGQTFEFRLSMPDDHTWNLSDDCSQCYDVQVIA